MLTGDSLFVGDAARPDLAVEAREGAEDLFASLRRLAELPGGVEVYPGHVAGSLCGASMSPDQSTTIGREKRIEADARRSPTCRTSSALGCGLGAAPADDGPRRRAEPRPVGAASAAPEPIDDAGDAIVLDVRPVRALRERVMCPARSTSRSPETRSERRRPSSSTRTSRSRSTPPRPRRRTGGAAAVGRRPVPDRRLRRRARGDGAARDDRGRGAEAACSARRRIACS